MIGPRRRPLGFDDSVNDSAVTDESDRRLSLTTNIWTPK